MPFDLDNSYPIQDVLDTAEQYKKDDESFRSRTMTRGGQALFGAGAGAGLLPFSHEDEVEYGRHINKVQKNAIRP